MDNNGPAITLELVPAVDDISPSLSESDDLANATSDAPTPFTQSGDTSLVEDEPTPMDLVASTHQKKKKKKKAKKSNKAKEAAAAAAQGPGKGTADMDGKPPVLCISRNKHWRYISSYHVCVTRMPCSIPILNLYRGPGCNFRRNYWTRSFASILILQLSLQQRRVCSLHQSMSHLLRSGIVATFRWEINLASTLTNIITPLCQLLLRCPFRQMTNPHLRLSTLACSGP